MNLNEWAATIHENAVAHGWWESERELPEILMLIVSELAEALEESRAGRPMEWHLCKGSHEPCDEAFCSFYSVAGCTLDHFDPKPEGIAVEVIDALIRILDWCGHEGMDVESIVAEKHLYNTTRPYKHGKKY